MDIVWGILSTLFLMMSLVWALLPAGFGVMNYRKKHSGLLRGVALLNWYVLLLVHPLVIYLVWSGISNNKEIVYSWLFLPLTLQVLFLMSFSRDVSTS